MRVLVVDDHPRVVESVSELLDGEFEIVGTASNGRAMIDAEALLRPDVIVTDLAMPGLNGLDASRAVLKERPGLPIVVLSMHRDLSLVRNALEAGVRAYVDKLRAGDELIPAIHSALQGSTFVSSNCLPAEIQGAVRFNT